MNKRISIWYFIGFIVIVMVVTKIIDNHKDYKFKSEIERLEKERLELRKQRDVYKHTIDSLNTVKTRLELKIDSLNAKVDSIKQIRNEIPSIVDNMPIVELDSILTGYVHPTRN